MFRIIFGVTKYSYSKFTSIKFYESSLALSQINQQTKQQYYNQKTSIELLKTIQDIELQFQQLKKYQDSHIDVHNILNNLSYIGIALEHKKYHLINKPQKMNLQNFETFATTDIHKIVRLSLNILQYLLTQQSNMKLYHENQVNLCIGNLYYLSRYIKDCQAIKLLEQIYINSYQYIVSDVIQHLNILYHARQNQNHDHLLQEISLKHIELYFKKNQNYSYRQLVHYVRIVHWKQLYSDHNDDNHENRIKIVNQLASKLNLIDSLNQQDQIYVIYMLTMLLQYHCIQIFYKFIHQLGILENWQLNQQYPKMCCLKLETVRTMRSIEKFQGSKIVLNCWYNIIYQLNNMNFINWPYEYLMWVVEFVDQDSQALQQIHLVLIKIILNHNYHINMLFNYLIKLQDQSQKHSQICLWLCSHTNQLLKSLDQIELCQFLVDLHLEQYKEFYLRVIDCRMGSLDWQSMNMLYYSGLYVQPDENIKTRMQSLRIYILNGYASFGINRKLIPTNSYFYKILQKTTPNKFYADYYRTEISSKLL